MVNWAKICHYLGDIGVSRFFRGIRTKGKVLERWACFVTGSYISVQLIMYIFLIDFYFPKALSVDVNKMPLRHTTESCCCDTLTPQFVLLIAVP